MASIAVVFPGQGSQRPGMGRDFHDDFRVARDAFEEANESLALDLKGICFEDDERLNLTEFTQPAILTTEVAMLRVLKNEFGVEGSYFGGHSLGEYTALVAAGVLGLADAVRFVRRRGALMQEAVPRGEGAMSAIIAEGIADMDLQAVLVPLEVDVANRNATNQVVISGRREGVEAFGAKLALEHPGLEFRVVPLNVSAPFHSRLMAPIEEPFRVLLEARPEVWTSARAGRVLSNYSGGFHETTREPIAEALTRQISGTVRWIENMRTLVGVADVIYEIGPNRPLKAFFASLGKTITSIHSLRTAQKELTKA